MNIMHVITTLDVGGAEMHLLSQVRGQTGRGHRVRMAYLRGYGTLIDDFRAAGAEEIVALGSGPSLPFKLRRHLKWADLVHSHLLKADMATAVVATLFGHRKRLISGKHNDEQVLTKPVVSFVHGLLGNLPQRTIVLSDHVGRFIARHGRVREHKLERVYYGIDPAPFEAAAAAGPKHRAAIRAEFGFGADDIVFICVARFAPQKAHAVLLKAFDAARRASGPALRLLLVGDDPFADGRPQTERIANDLGLVASGAVVFCGIRRDVPELLAASDVFVMSSLWEGLGLVFLEAMACSLPVLATDVSAVPEVVLDGETGLLVPPSDVEGLQAGMLALAGDPELRRAMGERGRVRVRGEFGLDRMVDETLVIYEAVVAAAE